jgi:hypothetical protein
VRNGLDDRHHRGACGMKLTGHDRQQRTHSCHEDAPPDEHALPFEKRLRTSDGEDTRQRPARNRHRPIVCARRNHDSFRRDAFDTLAARDFDAALFEDAPGGGVECEAHAARASLREQRGAVVEALSTCRARLAAKGVWKLPEDLPAGPSVVVDNEHVGAGPGRFNPGTETGGPAADDEHFGVCHRSCR